MLRDTAFGLLAVGPVHAPEEMVEAVEGEPEAAAWIRLIGPVAVGVVRQPAKAEFAPVTVDDEVADKGAAVVPAFDCCDDAADQLPGFQHRAGDVSGAHDNGAGKAVPMKAQVLPGLEGAHAVAQENIITASCTHPMRPR